MPQTPRLWATLDPFVEEGPILGRRVANASFLRALLEADPYDGYHFFLPNEENRRFVRDWIAREHPERSGKVRLALRLALQESLRTTDYHCLHLSDAVDRFPAVQRFRNAFSPRIFPVTALTHSLSYAEYAARFAALLWGGVSSRDAVIVTSRSARAVMEAFFANTRAAYGLDQGDFPGPALPLIPLGVPENSLPEPGERWDSAHGQSAPARTLRRELGIDKERVFLCLSRFSPNSKMDLLPLFAAFKRAFALGLAPHTCVLLLAGWAEPDDDLPASLRAFAGSLGINTRLILRPTDEERRVLYAAADVFVSPSDNIQETFGLTVAEAITASLPVIASDFDGYRDIVTPECGLLVPTTGFAESAETDVQSALWHDSQYHLKLAQQTVVHVPELARALCLLGNDPALAARLGRAGRQRGRELFTWAGVLEKYVALWDSLAATPLGSGEESRLRNARHPQGMRFAELFAGHCGRVLDANTLSGLNLARTAAGEAVYRGLLPVHHYSGMESILDARAVRQLLLAARKASPATLLLERLEEHFSGDCLLPAMARERAAQTLLWALKQDYLEVAD